MQRNIRNIRNISASKQKPNDTISQSSKPPTLFAIADLVAPEQDEQLPNPQEKRALDQYLHSQYQHVESRQVPAWVS